MAKKEKPLTPGTVVVFDPSKFDPFFWDDLSEAERRKYYGPLGYGADKPKLWVWMGPILDSDGSDSGHCVLISLSDQKIETMRHTSDFRRATEEEF